MKNPHNNLQTDETAKKSIMRSKVTEKTLNDGFDPVHELEAQTDTNYKCQEVIKRQMISCSNYLTGLTDERIQS